MENTSLPKLFVSSPENDDVVVESYVWSLAKRIWEADDGRKRKIRRPDKTFINGEMPPAAKIYVERILLLVAYAASSEFTIEDAKNKVNVIPSERFRGFMDVYIPVSALLPDGGNNYEPVADAIHFMQSVVFRFDTKEAIHFDSMIVQAELRRTGLVYFSVAPLVWEKILNFSKGFQLTEFWVAKVLSSARSLAMYRLIRNLKKPLTISLERIVQRLNLPPEYSIPSYLERHALNIIQKELNEKAPWSFFYERKEETEPRKTGKRAGRPKKIVKYVLKSFYIKSNDRNVQAALPCETTEGRIIAIDEFVARILKANGFSEEEMASISGLLVECCERFGVNDFCTRMLCPDFYAQWVKVKNRNAFLVKSIKEWLAEPR